MGEKPRVAHIKSPYLPYSETFIYNYISHLKRYKPVVITKEAINQDQFPTDHVITLPAWWSPLEKLRGFLTTQLKRFVLREPLYERGYVWALRQVQPDVIHAHFGLRGLFMLPVKRRLGIPMVVSFYGLDLSELPQAYGQDVYVRYGLFEAGERFTAEGRHARRCLIDLGCPEDKIEVLHIGVDLTRFPFLPRYKRAGEKVRILFTGRLIEKKGLLYALRAIDRLRDQTEKFEFTIIGDGPQRNDAERLISELSLEPYVHLVGTVRYEEFQKACAQAHIFLAPSVTDLETGVTEGGAPTVLLEAQAAGMPVVSTYHADIPEVVRDGVSGLLSPERDVEALAANLATMVLHPERWPEMGAAGRRHVENNYEIGAQARRLEQIYDAARVACAPIGHTRVHREASQRSDREGDFVEP